MSEASNGKDSRWNYAFLPEPNNTNNVKCNFCGKVQKEGLQDTNILTVVFVIPNLVRNIWSMLRVEIREYVAKKKQLKEQMDAIPHFDDIVEEQEQWESQASQQKNISHGRCPSDVSLGHSSEYIAQRMQQKRPRSIGPVDLYFMQDEAVKQRKNKDGGKFFYENMKVMRKYAIPKFCQWMYDTWVPFNSVRVDSFGLAIEALGQFGLGMKPPSYHEVSIMYLKKELKHTRVILREHYEIKANMVARNGRWLD
ncbi:UNVERIFIED_CONTAM: hypothetical protein Sangu_1727300 [Sesamum angustifolium]|uniref:Uncharacterized protein n=1 Tax=Sesamum angustifolium TaxID=2727405 RepID=A0AAW2M636_9LAMI